MNNRELSRYKVKSSKYKFYLRGESIKKIFLGEKVNKSYNNYINSKYNKIDLNTYLPNIDYYESEYLVEYTDTHFYNNYEIYV